MSKLLNSNTRFEPTRFSLVGALRRGDEKA